MSPGTIIGALAQLTFLILVGWATSEAVARRIGALNELGGPERTLLALAGAVVSAVALMVGHVVTGGAVFGVVGLVPALAILWLVACRRLLKLPRRLPWRPLLAFAVLLFVIYAIPAWLGGSGVRTGDSPWHLGWSEQLLAGEAVPTGPAPEFGRNAYPWGWHAVIATMVRLVPGTAPLVAYEALHLLLLAGAPLAAACLARRVDARAGWGAAAAVSLVGGFGWILSRGPAFVATPGEARYGADLVVASPNSVYELFPPALPRELGVVLLGVVGLLVLIAVRSDDRRVAIVAGVATGVLGLVSVPLFVSALVWTATILMGNRGSLGHYWLHLFGPLVVVFALWAGPVAADYVRFGGFVDITPILGKEWPLWTALGAWGLLLPAAVGGALLGRNQNDARSLLLCAAASIVLVALALARGAHGWTLGGHPTLLHQGRVWPAAHLLAAAFAGVAIVRAYSWLARRSRFAVATACAVVLPLAAASPVLASLKLTEIIQRAGGGFVYGAADLSADSFVRGAAAELDPADVVRVQGDPKLGLLLFEFSGVKVTNYDDPRLDGNDLRIRYRDRARAWDQRMASGGFRPSHVAVPVGGGLLAEPSTVVALGRFRGEEWVLVEAGGRE